MKSEEALRDEKPEKVKMKSVEVLSDEKLDKVSVVSSVYYIEEQQWK